jgi:energy-coupling factor transporter ATP-binding protein EcfA2
MILEGFEIENWSCIQRVAVTDLPATGVVVLHGPNGTGKSSIIEALRACLMDNKSTSKALERGFPKNSSEKPRVSVAFRVAGTTWKITKQFNSKESRLEIRTSTGQWKLETTDPSEAHERARALTGGSDSSLGLQQLMWLTQAEFHLPDPKKFDVGVQARLRSVLGVLQTPLDDRFLGRVKEEWSRWFGARSKPGDKPRLKKDCPLDKALAALEQHKAEVAQIEAEFQDFERLMEKSSDLEVLSRDLRRQLEERTLGCNLLQAEYERSLKRLEAHRLASERVTQAEKALVAGLALRQKRAEAERRVHDAQKHADTASQETGETSRRLHAAEQKLRELRREFQDLESAGRQQQARLNQVNHHRQVLALKDQVKTAQESLKLAELSAGELDDLKRRAREHPAPDAATLKRLEENRAQASQLRADLDAAAITLTLLPETGAAAPCLAIDGATSAQADHASEGKPIECSIRRRAEIAIPSWGRITFTRGSDARDLDQIEKHLNDLHHKFAEWLAPFGIASSDPAPLDRLRVLVAEKKVRDPELKRKQDEIDRLAPDGLEPLRQEVARLLEKLLSSCGPMPGSVAANLDLPTDYTELDELATQLQIEIEEAEKTSAGLRRQIQQLEGEIDGDLEAESIVNRQTKPAMTKTIVLGLRRQEASAKEKHFTLNATANVLRDELERMLTVEQIDREIRDAEEALGKARSELASAALSESEESISDRLKSAREGVKAIESQLKQTERDFNLIKGEIRGTEGLHQKRAAAAARVEELTRLTEREKLVSEAYDRLYALFEECREKQLSAVMGPIHDRVLRWMKLLRIAGYQSIRFNDQFLPEKLLTRDGASELALHEESIGTIEQFALMVRLALGSALSTSEEPVVAMLDDPLTHSDVVRLDRMRAVLRSAAAGDPGSTPPAGPLQIFVFTCHPEWFAIDGAKIVDLGKPEVMSRLSF